MASQAKQERLEDVRQQVASGELVIRHMTAAERERYGLKPLPAPEPELVRCEHCGQPHDPTPREACRAPRRFCSRRCAALGSANERAA